MARPSVRILSRYLLRQHLAPLAFALGSLTAFLMIQQIAKQFGSLVGKGLSWSVIAEVFVLSIPFIVAMTLPMAVLVAVLHTFTRLGADNEITAMKAGGISLARVVAPVLGGAALVTAIALVWNDQVLPRANHRLAMLQRDIMRKKPSFSLKEQVINEVVPGQFFLRVARSDEARVHLEVRAAVVADLRRLAGLPVAPLPPDSSAMYPQPGLLCRAWSGLIAWLAPAEAEAAQRPERLPRIPAQASTPPP